ncbi:hypothetical protein SAMN04515648_3403 [Phyllobacterium sp. CL33Tsu]|nr:hypothetical protein SAMN04515648_3403 [Phyllobacterium sp. CL33Tsu]
MKLFGHGMRDAKEIAVTAVQQETHVSDIGAERGSKLN